MARFAFTIFLGAFLLFQVQPLIGRFILPWFGGGPAVWATCMLFFQTLLLAGYTYAHVLGTKVPLSKQPIVHAVLLLATLLLLPIGVSDAFKPTSEASPIVNILLMLTVSIGGPYTILSATGPLLQSWFRHAHPDRSPYRLYALSNVGSILALLTYPFLFEPLMTLRDQSLGWSVGYGAFAAGILACAWAVVKLAGPAVAMEKTGEQAEATKQGGAKENVEADATDPKPQPGELTRPSHNAPPTFKQHALWVALAALGSVILLATTNQLCLDLAVVPFLWVLPLVLYLLTFVICFDRESWYSPGWYTLLAVIALTGVAWVMDEGVHASIFAQVGLYSLALFAGCMLCHGQLVRTKPHPRFLTGFYLSVSLGGALGGAFVAIVAPLTFTGYYEYPVALVGVCCIGAWATISDKRGLLNRMDPMIASILPLAATGTLACVIIIGAVTRPPGGGSDRGVTLANSRNFYGVLRVLAVNATIDVVEKEPNAKGKLEDKVVERTVKRIELEHGRITHGDQYDVDSLRRTPTTYYGYESGVGMAILEHPRRWLIDKTRPFKVGVVGLGTGSVAAYGMKGEVYRFYEINPQVPKYAEKYFSYLKDTQATTEVVLGDARIVLERELAANNPQAFDVLVVDAFSGDAIPVHLLTKQAGDLYFKHMKEDGILALHISNRFIDLRPVTRGLAKELGAYCLLIESESNAQTGADAASWVVLTRNEAFVQSNDLKRYQSTADRTVQMIVAKETEDADRIDADLKAGKSFQAIMDGFTDDDKLPRGATSVEGFDEAFAWDAVNDAIMKLKPGEHSKRIEIVSDSGNKHYRWVRLQKKSGVKLWTDDFSSVWSLLMNTW